MKIKIPLPMWLKITILTAIVFFVMAELFTQYFKNKGISDYKIFSQNMLLDNAILIAAGINGDEHKLAIMDSESSRAKYQDIKNYLEKVKKAIDWQ